MNLERRNQIIEMINKQMTVKNSELMEKFNISIETVRRDLAHLEKQGFLERVYGGAVKKNFMHTEPEYISRESENSDIKKAIAQEAIKCITNSDIVFFDLGTTVLALARSLDNSKEITAFTNALRTAIALSENGCDVFIPGGNLRKGELSVSGFDTAKTMEKFNVDKAFIGAAGITEEGITDFIPEEASLRSQIIKNARKVIVVTDSSKFGIRAMCKICSIEDIDVLITDDKAPMSIIKKIKKSGVQVIQVKL